MMVKKYDNYMRADSIEFSHNREISKASGSSYAKEMRFRGEQGV